MVETLHVKKKTGIVITLVTAVFILGLFLQRTNISTHTLSWSPYSNSSSPEEIGYLAVLEKSDDSSKVLLSLDKKPSTDTVALKTGWEVNVISENRLWNPRICSKMPVAITPGGDIYMFESRRTNGGDYESFIVWYNYDAKTISESKIDEGKFVGKKMFLDENENPYFFMKSNKALLLSTINRHTKVLTQKKIMAIGDLESITLTMSTESLPVIEVYDTVTFATKRYELRNGFLEKFNGDTKGNLVSYQDDVRLRDNLEHGFVAEYRLDSPYETRILQVDKVILEFLPEDKIYSYAVGSFTSP